MKLAYHGATHMPSDLATDLAASSQAGFTAIEVWSAKIDRYLETHSPSEMKALFAVHGVEAASINSIEFIGFRGSEYASVRQRCRDLCAAAEAIDCHKLVVVPSPTPAASGDTVLQLFYPWEKVVDEYVNVLGDLANIAAPYGVGLCFEFIGFAWCSVRTPKGAWEIVKKVGRDNVGINFDACHFYGGGGEMSEIDRLDPKKIYTFHINDMEDVPKEAMTDARRLLPGDGVVPLADICRHLKGIGYDGWCAIELFRPEYWRRDPYELAVEARKKALRVLSPYFNVE